jgi:hypothetical protein
VAVIEQKPALTRVTVEPEAVQMAAVVEVYTTGSPELAVAVIVNGVYSKGWLLRAPKVMTCGAGFTNIARVLLVDPVLYGSAL